MSDQGWQNRIVGEGEEAPDQLLAHPDNWRVHPKAQQRALADVLDKVGWVQRVIVNRTTGRVLDGHLRVALAISRNEQAVPVQYVELTEVEERLVLAVFDPIGEMATTDRDKLRDVVGSLNDSEGAALARMLHAKAVEVDSTPTPEMRLSPEVLERQDYLVITFDNEMDWRVACEWLGVQSSRDGDANAETQRGRAFGLGRVLTGKELLERRNA